MGSTADSCGSSTSIPPTLSPPNPKPKPAPAIPSTSPAVQAPLFMKSGRAPADPMCAPKLPQVFLMDVIFDVVPPDRESRRKLFEVMDTLMNTPGIKAYTLDFVNCKLTLRGFMINVAKVEQMLSRICYAKTFNVARANTPVKRFAEDLPENRTNIGQM